MTEYRILEKLAHTPNINLIYAVYNWEDVDNFDGSKKYYLIFKLELAQESLEDEI